MKLTIDEVDKIIKLHGEDWKGVAKKISSIRCEIEDLDRKRKEYESIIWKRLKEIQDRCLHVFVSGDVCKDCRKVQDNSVGGYDG